MRFESWVQVARLSTFIVNEEISRNFISTVRVPSRNEIAEVVIREHEPERHREE